MGTNVSIVIIDDNAGSLELLSAALGAKDVQIYSATDPEEGLDIVFREHPQIVLTDLLMPGLSGLEVLDRIVDFDSAIEVILLCVVPTD
jgi:CheY-like chemotaxis protein